MFAKIKRLYAGILAISEIHNNLKISANKFDSILYDVQLSPIDKQVATAMFCSQSGLFDETYNEWRMRRINKMLEIYGIDFFQGKRVVEVGAGHGEIGAFFASLGADVTCLDGRIQNINIARLKHRNIKNLSFKLFDLEKDFTSIGKFDLMIHFGLLYHIKNVEQHLNWCFKVSDDIVHETVVCDSTDPDKLFLCDERRHVDEEALNGIGSRPSPFYVERIAQKNGFKVERFFTNDLNCREQFCYDWEHKNDDRLGDAFKLRRFWRFKKEV